MILPWEALIENMPIGFAYRKVLRNESGQVVDYVFLLVNSTYEKITGLKAEDLVNKQATKAIPHIEDDTIPWIEIYSKVVETQKPQTLSAIHKF